MEFKESLPYLCRVDGNSATAFTSQTHHIMNTMNNPKLQALLDLFSVNADAVYNCGLYDELTSDEQMQLEQLLD